MSNSKVLFIIAFVAAAGFFAYRMLGSTDAQLIKKRIEQLAQDASVGEELQGVQIHARSVQLTKHLSPAFSGQVELRDGATHSVPSKQEAIQSFSAAFFVLKPLKVEIRDLKISVQPGASTADAELSLNLKHSRVSVPFDRVDFRLSLVKADGEWLIERASGVVAPGEK
ncbi:MAG TPA: hypothetical protein VFV50_04460 [Bdellovibrionales bacterium]|nr:hypothetical protein [Bdellovibrionales bacterium]